MREFFELDYGQEQELFDVYAYPGGPTKGAEAELRVAKRIREYLQGERAWIEIYVAVDGNEKEA